MSVKDDINYIKNELNNEEKFLENFVKTERFFKKYKKLILVSFFVFVCVVVFVFVKNILDEKNLYEANLALNKFLETKDKEALETLKNKNKNLYEIALYLEAKKEIKDSEISLKYLKDLLAFQLASINSNKEKLDLLAKNGNFLLKDYAIFNRALILTNEEKFDEAKSLLEGISSDSKAFELANFLKHYLATK